MSLRAGRRWDTVIVWFRRDLRVHDHPALSDAVANAARVIPLFVVDPRLVAGALAAPARTWLLAGSLEVLDAALRERGGSLIVRSGRPEEIVPALARETGAEAVLVSRDVTPLSHRRDSAVAEALARDGRRLLARPGLLLVEPEEMLTDVGRPYAVFTPFWRALRAAGRRDVLASPPHVPTPRGLAGDGAMLLPAALQRRRPPLADLPGPGEAAALARLDRWVEEGLAGYGEGRDRLAGDRTSRLGQDLHLGLLSARQVEAAAAPLGEDATAWLRQVAWREFYQHLLFGQRSAPDGVPESPLMAAFRAEEEDPAAVAAWREGSTGIPVVDAAMRQLAATGWISNRARLVVASFLTRHLLMDYRLGERHFLRTLVDGDVANNRGGWRWTAGVGADPQPWFRIFNPVLQGRRFDPDGGWVRRWVPELAGVPDRAIHAPWDLSDAEAQRAGLRPGDTYPQPIVDLAVARERALTAFRAVSGGVTRSARPRPTAGQRRPGPA